MRRIDWMPVCFITAGIIIIGAMLCTAAHAGTAKVQEPLRPFWTGPVYGVFTDAGPDSAAGPRAKIHVPVGVAITDPFHVRGMRITPEVEFQWTTKAYMGEDSDPLQDPTYNWFPKLRIQPDSTMSEKGLLWATIGPEHNSNGDVDPQSRSMNQLSIDTAWRYDVSGIVLHIYAKGWFVYDYGEGTGGMKEVVNLVNNVGGKLTVVGSASMLDLGVELGPEWQKYMMYIPLADFYKFGLYTEVHNGKLEGFLNYGEDVMTVNGGFAMRPRL